MQGSQLYSDFSQGLLRTVVHEARNLTPEERPDRQDPYVRITVGDMVHKTKPIENGGLNPIWNMDNIFEFVLEGKESTIFLEVFDNNLLKDTLIGRSVLNLTEVIANANGEMQWIRLGRGDKSEVSSGELAISFQYIPPVTISVDEIRYLMDKDIKPIVEMTLGGFSAKTSTLESGLTRWESGNVLKFNMRGVDVQNDELVIVGKSKGLLSDSTFGRTTIPVRDLVRPQTKQWYSLTDSVGRKTGEVYLSSFYNFKW